MPYQKYDVYPPEDENAPPVSYDNLDDMPPIYPIDTALEYEAASTTYQLQPPLRWEERVTTEFIQYLNELGWQTLRFQYEGGNDEGFAVLSGAVDAAGQDVPEAELYRSLDADRLRTILRDEVSEMGGSLVYQRSASRGDLAELIGTATMITSEALATALLGDGFGIGDLELRGRFELGIGSSELTDRKLPGDTIEEQWNGFESRR